MNEYRKYSNEIVLATVSKVAFSMKGIILIPVLTKSLGTEQYGSGRK